MKEQLIALFNCQKPSVSKYHEFVDCMPPEERGIFCTKTFGIALAEWGSLNLQYRQFLIRLIKSERQAFIDYIRKDTILGEFLYELGDLDLFLKVLNLWMQPCNNSKSSYTEMSFSLLLILNVDLSVKYFADKIRYSRMDSFDFVELLEKSSDIE